MAEQYGIDELLKIADSVADLVNVGEKVLKGNYLALFQLSGTLGALRSVDFAKVKAEIADLDPGELEALEKSFDVKLDIADAVMKQKIEDGVDILGDCVTLAEESVKVFQDGKAIVEKFRSVVGV